MKFLYSGKIKEMKQKHLIYIVIGVILSWIVIPAAVMLVYGKPDSSGTFGDTFGVINALFSSLAFALLIYTAWMQKEELSLQRKELRLTRREMKKSAAAQLEQADLIKDQLVLQRTIRRSQIRPQLLGPYSVEQRTDDKGFYFVVTFSVGYNSMKIDSVAVKGTNSDNIVASCLGSVEYVYINPEQEVQMEIYHDEYEKFDLEHIIFWITILDTDSNKYVQVLMMFGGKPMLFDPIFKDETLTEMEGTV